MSDSHSSSLFLPNTNPNFAEKIDEKYICVSCKGLLSPPVKQTLCGHRMCAACIVAISQSAGSAMCPGNEPDCVDIGNKGNVFPDFGTEREMKKLKVFCMNKDYGCDQVLPWGKLKEHLSGCQYLPSPCPYSTFGCPKLLSHQQLETHKSQCPYQPLVCKHCHKDIPKYQFEEENHEAKCLNTPQECRYKPMGCNFSGTKDVLDKHVNSDHAQHIEVLMSIIANLQNSENRLKVQIEEFKNENIQLKNKAEEAQNETRKMKSKLDAKILALQKMTGGNTEDIIELKKFERQINNVKLLEDTAKSHETRIGHLENRSMSTAPVGGGGLIMDEIATKVKTQEQSIQMHDIRLAEYDLRFQSLETTNYEGVLIWKIKDYRRRKIEAVQGRTISLYSQSFYTSKYGYKMCARVYLNGDGMGKNSHLSLFFVVMKGEYDALLRWPFRQKVTLSLMDQENGSRHLSDTFKPDPTSNSFKRPLSEMNVASGCPLFVAQEVLESSKYLIDDTIYIKISVDTAETFL